MRSEYLQKRALPGTPPRAFPFQEVWFVKANRVGEGERTQAVWLRFTLLSSANGFKRVAEVWAIFSERDAQREVSKLALKQTFALQDFIERGDPAPDGETLLQIGECVLGRSFSRGEITSKGKTIRWDLQMNPRADRAAHKTMNFVPEGLRRAGVVRNTAVTESEDLLLSGRIEVDGVVHEWAGNPGMLGHFSGPRSGHSWFWGHCNHFVDAEGRPQDFIFEGLSARAVLAGPWATPRLSSFYFHYQGRDHVFNSVWDALRAQSEGSWTEWTFQAERGELLFRGKCKADLKDFVGLNYEDTNGSFIHCASTQLGDAEIQVYRQGKLEASFRSKGTAAFEVASRERNPYVATLV